MSERAAKLFIFTSGHKGREEKIGKKRGFGLSISAGINPKALKPSSVWTLGMQYTLTHTLQTSASSSLCLPRTPGVLNPVQHQHASCPYSQTLSATLTLQQGRYVNSTSHTQPGYLLACSCCSSVNYTVHYEKCWIITPKSEKQVPKKIAYKTDRK